MVRILTKDYTELDLTKGFEFQIEMENPMLDEEHIPSAFSTQISFPPSPVNRKVFGYTPAMFLAPNVKRLEASVWIGGVPFVTGTLVYDGIEDGCLMYTSTEKVVELEGKIWEKSILEFDTGSIPSSSAKFSTPLLINKNNVAVQPYSKASRLPVSGEPEYGIANVDSLLYLQKYYNYISASESIVYKTIIPAVPIRAILTGCRSRYQAMFCLETDGVNYPSWEDTMNIYMAMWLSLAVLNQRQQGSHRNREVTERTSHRSSPTSLFRTFCCELLSFFVPLG